MDPSASVAPKIADRPRLVFSVNAPIKGIHVLAPEDRKSVEDLMFHAMTVKCHDGNFASDAYQRPRFWRVESLASGDYLLIIGGWEDLDLEDLQKINRWDAKPENARNIIGIRVVAAADNDPPHSKHLAVSIRYCREQERRRRMASPTAVETRAEPTPPSNTTIASQMGAPSKKRGLISDVVNWIAFGSSSPDE